MLISVIVRCHNDSGYIRGTLKLLREQLCESGQLEICLFDDHSTDGTPELVRRLFPDVRLFSADDAPYNPARVLNRAFAAVSGDIIVCNNSDALPLTRDYIDRLIAPLADPLVGAVYGNQLARCDAFPLVRKDNDRAFGDGKTSGTWSHMFSMASSGCRREIAEKFAFDPNFQYSEDIDWSLRVKRAGYKIVYVPDAKVEHSHNYSMPELKKRFYNEGWANGQLSGGRKPSFLRALLGAGREVLRDISYLRMRGDLIRCLLPGLRYRMTQRYSAYRGECDYFKKMHGAK